MPKVHLIAHLIAYTNLGSAVQCLYPSSSEFNCILKTLTNVHLKKLFAVAEYYWPYHDKYRPSYCFKCYHA